MTLEYDSSNFMRKPYRKIADWLAKHVCVPPDSVTILSFVCGLVMFALLTCGKYLLAFLFLQTSCFLDFLDGSIARRYKKVSDAGDFLDETISSRPTNTLLFFGLAIHLNTFASWTLTFLSVTCLYGLYHLNDLTKNTSLNTGKKWWRAFAYNKVSMYWIFFVAVIFGEVVWFLYFMAFYLGLQYILGIILTYLKKIDKQSHTK